MKRLLVIVLLLISTSNLYASEKKDVVDEFIKESDKIINQWRTVNKQKMIDDINFKDGYAAGLEYAIKRLKEMRQKDNND